MWIVSDQNCPDVDFATIQPAIDAAAEGDTILVRPHKTGDYGPVDISGKSLTIVSGEATLSPSSYRIGDLTIRNLAASQSVTIVGISRDLGGQAVLENNQGVIWIEDARFRDSATIAAPPHYETLRIENCASVALVDCTVIAPDYSESCAPTDPCLSVAGKVGTVVIDSEVHFYQSGSIGSEGGPGYDPLLPGGVGGAGGVGIWIERSTVNGLGGAFIGGDGGVGGPNSPAPMCADGGPGGPGVWLADTQSQVRVHDCNLVAGSGGEWTSSSPVPGGCMDGPDGPPVAGPGAANVVTTPGSYRWLQFFPSYALMEGLSRDLLAVGLPGDLVFLGVAGVPAPEFDPLFGFSTAFTPIKILNLKSLGASNSKTIPILPGDVTTPNEAVTAYLQSYHFDTSLDLFIGRPVAATILDASHDVFDGCDGVVYVDDDAPGDPGPGDPGISDPLEDGTLAHPFDSIQEALDSIELLNSKLVLLDGVHAGGGPFGFDMSSSPIRIESMNGPENCAIDMSGSNPGMRFIGGLLNLSHGISGVTLMNASNRAIDIVGSDVTIENCVFENNSSTNGGAGIRMTNSCAVIRRCVFRDNTSGNSGGAIFAQYGAPVIENCTVEGNSAPAGGGMALPKLGAVVRGCTVANNTGGGITFSRLARSGEPSPRLENSIVWGNTGGDQVNFSSSELAVPYADVQGGLAGIFPVAGGAILAGPGLIDVDPLFIDAAGGDFHLSVGSPCIDAGDPGYVAAPGETDIDGDPRVVGSAVDLGSDEL